MNPTFDQVSDTSLLVAAARAIETDREDGFVNDPLAATLAGERGKLLLQSMSRGLEWIAFGIGLRSRFIDDFVEEVIGKGEIDTVLNLGAGLDTRPWRLALPETLHWIEVDFPHVITYKSEALADYLPQCQLEQIAADLTSADALLRVLEHASTAANSTLVITEGVLTYLSQDDISRIATEAHARHAFHYWIYDIMPDGLQRLAHGVIGDDIDRLRADPSLEGETVARLLRTAGWRHVTRRDLMRDSRAGAEKRVAKIIATMVERGQPVPTEPPVDDGHSGVWLCER